MKKIGIINNSNKQLIDTLANYFVNKNIEVCCFQNLKEIDKSMFNVILLYNNTEPLNNEDECKFFNIHPSLLPAFSGSNALEESFKSGVKISGITISDAVNNKITAQYPVLITNLMHFDEYKRAMIKAECILIPPVAEALLENKTFDIETLLTGSNCNGCCNHGTCSGTCK